MKRALQISFLAFCFLIVASSLYYFLLPERSSKSAVELRVIDTNENEQYKKDVLAEHNSSVNEKVSRQLEEIKTSSEMNLMVIENAIKEFGPYSKEVKNLVEVKDMQDGINLKKVTEIIDKYGWLGAERIGAQNSYTLFTAIQNSDFDTQEKYIPVMRRAVASGTLSAEHFANLVDRKAIVQHHKQIYGTLIEENTKEHSYSFAPIADRESINKRRKEIGLKSIEEYAKERGVTYGEVKSEG